MRLPTLLGCLAMTVPLFAAEFPDPLKMQDGSKVVSKDEWLKKRKPELRKLFESHVYGKYPVVKTAITSKVLFEDSKAFDGLGTVREVEVSLGIEGAPPLRVLLAIPNEYPRFGAPVFVGLNFHGNHAILDDERIAIPTSWMYPNAPGAKENKATAAGRGKDKNIWPIEQILKAGYAVVTCTSGDIDPDEKDKRGGVRPALGKLEPKADTATIMAWAWGLHRLVDFTEMQPEFNPKRIAVFGHSRLGKTALLAGAFDDRIACVFPHQAGCGGTGPSRHDDPKAESVKRITTAFPHWFNKSFAENAESLDKVPVDQHGLLAMCAPRPVFYSNAKDDLWANPSGQFEMMKRATPVYELLGVKGLETEAMPEIGKPVESRLGYWMREGKHETNPDDWKAMIRFADKWMK